MEILRDTYYSTEENLEHIESFSAELFDRTPEDEDFLDIYLGVGKREAERKLSTRNRKSWIQEMIYAKYQRNYRKNISI